MTRTHNIAGSEVGRSHPPAWPTAYAPRTGGLTRWLAFLRLVWSPRT